MLEFPDAFCLAVFLSAAFVDFEQISVLRYSPYR